MITTITVYKCDRCGAEQNTSEQFWSVGIVAGQDSITPQYKPMDRQMHVCRKCLNELGVFSSSKSKEEKVPMIEGLIREVAQRCP